MIDTSRRHALGDLLRRSALRDPDKTAIVYGDLRRIHRTGLIACVYRASEWRHKDIELAAHDLLQYLDAKAGLKPSG